MAENTSKKNKVVEKVVEIEIDTIEEEYENLMRLFYDYIVGYHDMKEKIGDDKEACQKIDRAIGGMQRQINTLSTSYENREKVDHGMQIFKGFLAQAVIANRYYGKSKYLGGEEYQSQHTPLMSKEKQYVSADVVASAKQKQTFHKHTGEKIIEIKYRPSTLYSEKYETETLEELSAQVEKDIKVSGRAKVWWYGEMPSKIRKWANEKAQNPRFTYQIFVFKTPKDQAPF